MSAGDYLRHLRAMKGGPTPTDIESATGVPAGTYRQIEQRYRAVGDEEELAKLAEYFGVASQELTSRQPWTRKELSAFLVEAADQDSTIQLALRTGESMAGKVVWSDLGATLLRQADGRELVIQRHMIDRWKIV
jgi:transcriptional regulator with XRE-family HTH domain